jgi:hypothetical protein
MPCTLFFGEERRARVLVTLEDGTTLKLEGVVAVDVLDEGERRRTTQAPVKQSKKAARTYGAEAAVTDDEARELLRGSFDGRALGRDERERLMHLLTHLRRRCFKAAAAVWVVGDISVIGSALTAGVRPSDLAKAIVAAARDAWWRSRGDLSFQTLVKHVGSLAARYEQTKDGKHALIAMLATIGDIDPIARAQIEDRLASMSDAEATELTATWKRKIELKESNDG